MIDTLRLVTADAVAPQAWRNGGGRTRELFAWPPDAPWQLRLSLADIDQDGPFSAFDGVQRWFAVVSGAGVRLQFTDGERLVTASTAPLCFDGAAAPGCRLVSGPTRDLNLMLRGCAGGLRAAQPGQPGPGGRGWRGLFCHQAATLQRHGCPLQPLAAMTLAHAWVDDELPWQFSAASPSARAWWLHADLPAPALPTPPR